MKSQKGQVAIELVLMSVVLMAIIMSLTQKIRQNNGLARFVDGPWAQIDGMARHGVWGATRVAMEKDPNLAPRRGSAKGELER